MSTSDEAGWRRAGALAVLASFDAVGPRWLRLVAEHHAPEQALDLLASGAPLHPTVERGAGEHLEAFRSEARAAEPGAMRDRCERLGIRAVAIGDAAYPLPLARDPEAPAVLFARGDGDALDRRRVGIVGTRNATAAGRATAADLGRQLAEAGVAVVSGLARGIDGAAHRGVRAAAGAAVGVVANGLDRPYPARHAELWEWVAGHGLLLSEWPPGVAPVAWRFPQRNRIIAALCEVLVVVESRERGGSLITVRAALDRNVEVMAVPGSPRSRASAGTNQLLVDGAAPVTSAVDVLAMLGLDHRRQSELPFDALPEPGGLAGDVLAACRDRPSTIDLLVERLGRGVGEVALAIARLERDGWLAESEGWFEPARSRLWP